MIKEKMVTIPLAELKRYERMEVALADFVSCWRFEVRSGPRIIKTPKRPRATTKDRGGK